MQELRNVTVLYTMPKSVYLGMPGVDCWDEVRDARKWPGGTPVVAHPPCAPWGRLRTLLTVDQSKKDLAVHAVSMVKQFGGVLEHPAASTLWDELGLPRPLRGSRLEFTLRYPQRWWGHEAEKLTNFYVVGVPLEKMPGVPLVLGYPEKCIGVKRKPHMLPEISRRNRRATPLALAEWLVAVARLVQTHNQ